MNKWHEYLLDCVYWGIQLSWKCRHPRMPIAEGQCYCPDCGEGVVFQWVSLRCAGCLHRRATQYSLRRVFPKEAQCPACGTREVVQEMLESPHYYQALKAQLVAKRENPIGFPEGYFKTWAWMDSCQHRLTYLRLAG